MAGKFALVMLVAMVLLNANEARTRKHGHKNLKTLEQGKKRTKDITDLFTSCSESSKTDWDHDCLMALEEPNDEYGWLSYSQDQGAWMEVGFDMPYTMTEIQIKQHCEEENRVGSLTVSFDDGSSQDVTVNCDEGSCGSADAFQEIKLKPAVKSQSIKLEITDECGTLANNGIKKLRVYASY